MKIENFHNVFEEIEIGQLPLDSMMWQIKMDFAAESDNLDISNNDRVVECTKYNIGKIFVHTFYKPISNLFYISDEQ